MKAIPAFWNQFLFQLFDFQIALNGLDICAVKETTAQITGALQLPRWGTGSSTAREEWQEQINTQFHREIQLF